MAIPSQILAARGEQMSSIDPAASTTVVEAGSVSFTYPNGRRAIEDLNLTVTAGEIVGIVGPSGCGKSTFLSVLADSETPDSGRLKRPELGDLTMMFQNNTLLPWRTVEKNITLGFCYLNRAAPTQAYVDELLRLGRLTDVARSYPNELSGGMRRRAAFLTALAVKPKLILLDEPFSAIDEPTRIGIHQDVLRIVRETDTAVLLVTHDLSEAITLCDRVVIFRHAPGRVVAERSMPFGRDRDVFGLRRDDRYAAIYADLWEVLSREIKGGSDD